MTALPQRLQELPPKWAHFCLGLERFLTRELGLTFGKGRLVVSYSAGADSTALLLALRLLSPRLGCELTPVHLDHGIRPESAEDARHAVRFCQELGLDCVVAQRDVPRLAKVQGVGLEEAGRLARLQLLEEQVDMTSARSEPLEERGVWAVTGHQLNDLAEDQLMRQLRGAGWPALGGMRAVVQARRLLRPLLLTPKATLRAFLQENGVPWREDPSNSDRAFMRNRVRHELLPRMMLENPNYLETAAALWRQSRLDQEYWEQQTAGVRALCRQENEGLLLPAETMRHAPPALRLRLYKDCLESLGPGQPLAEGLFQLDTAWQGTRTGATLQFPGGKEATVTAKGVLFRGSRGD